MKNGGFTLVELIITMIILAIISVVAIPRMFNNAAFEARSYHDEVLASVRYAHKVAVAQRRNVFVNINQGNATLCLTYVADPVCNSGNNVSNPSGSAEFKRVAPNGIVLNTSNQFFFNALGQPVPNAQVNVTVAGAGVTRTITVERETGYVH